MRAQLELLEQQNRTLMASQARTMPQMQPQMVQQPQQMGMVQSGHPQGPIYIAASGGPTAYTTAQPGHYIEVQQAPPGSVPTGAVVQASGGGGMTHISRSSQGSS